MPWPWALTPSWLNQPSFSLRVTPLKSPPCQVPTSAIGSGSRRRPKLWSLPGSPSRKRSEIRKKTMGLSRKAPGAGAAAIRAGAASRGGARRQQARGNTLSP